MMRWALAGLLMAACTKKSGDPDVVAATPEAVPVAEAKPAVKETAPAGKPSGAPVAFSATVGETESVVEVAFADAGSDVVVEIWGAGGLTVTSDKAVWSGSFTEPTTKSFTVPHTGSGDLAVRVEGDFRGKRSDKVQSFTIGDRAPTPVPVTPVDGQPVKGWESTPK